MPVYKKIEISISNKEADALEDILYAELSKEQKKEYVAIVKKFWLRLIKQMDKEQPKKFTTRNKTKYTK